MAKNRLIENLVEKTREIKQKVKEAATKRVVPLVVAGGIALGSMFGLAGCDSKNNEVIKNDGIENSEIVELRDLVESLQDEVNDLKTAVDTKADLKTVSEISKELTSIAKTLTELTKNIANINEYYLSLGKKVEDMQQGMDKLTEMYNKQDEDLAMLINKLANLEAKVQTLANSNNNTNNSTSNNTSTNDLQSQIGEMKQVVNRLALENAIQKTANSRYNYIYDTNSYNHNIITAPNGDMCGVIEDDKGYNYYLAEDNFVCTLNADGTNYINYGDVNNTLQQLYVLCQGGYLSMSFDDCNITKDGNRFTISRTRDGKIDTIYVTLGEKGMLQYVQFDGEYLVIEGADRELYQNSYNECKVAKKEYNNLQKVINNSWANDCLVYSPLAEEGDEYNVYFNSEKGYMYTNEAEYGKTYGVSEEECMATITQTPNGELELNEQTYQQNLMQTFKGIILNNGENALISYNKQTNTYSIENKFTICKYVVEDGEIDRIVVLDKETNVEKECVRIISQSEFEQKADEIKNKFDELKAEYENSNTLGQ